MYVEADLLVNGVLEETETFETTWALKKWVKRTATPLKHQPHIQVIQVFAVQHNHEPADEAGGCECIQVFQPLRWKPFYEWLREAEEAD